MAMDTATNHRPIRVMVVEDNAADVMLVREALKVLAAAKARGVFDVRSNMRTVGKA